MIPRQITSRIQDLAGKLPIVAITGPRQSGKTTLAKALFPDYQYANLEYANDRQFALDDPERFLKQASTGLIVDEVQRVPALFSMLQVLADQDSRPGRFILTGSSNFLLMEQISQTLAGRTAILTLLPLALSELDHAENYEVPALDEVLYKGLYPRIYDSKLEAEDFYPFYTQTYLERDVRQIVNVSDLTTFQLFIRFCAGRVGQLFNQSAVANELGVSHTTVKRWLSILETSYIVFLLPPYFQNFNKRLVKTPKLYFYDTGLACNLLGIQHADQVTTHYARGALFENLVIAEMAKQFYNRGRQPPMYFWRDQSGHEIDLLVESGNYLHAFELKSSLTLQPKFFANLNYLRKIVSRPPVKSYLVYGGEQEQSREVNPVFSWKGLPKLI